MATDVERAIGPKAVLRRPARPNPTANWARFFLEMVVSGMVAGTLPFLRARRPYVVGLGRWMAREERRMPVGTRPEFGLAFEQGTLADFAVGVAADRMAKARADLARRYASCVVEYVRQPGISPLDHPVYLTFVGDAANWLGALLGRDRALRQVALEPGEVLAVRPLFPHLDRILTAFQAGTIEAEPPRSSAGSPPAPSAALADIRDVPGGGTLRTKGFLLALNLLGLIPLIFFFGGLAAMGVGAWGWWRGWSMATYLGLLLGGAASFALASVYSQNYSSTLETWFRSRRLRSVLELRPDAIVPTNDPDAEYVNLTRRENWATVQVDVIDDVGLLRLDERRRELRIEGDRRRYRFPLAAIADCGPECFHHPIDKQMLKQFWYVRLRMADDRSRELFLAPRIHGTRTNATRRKAVTAFCRRLQRLGVPALEPPAVAAGASSAR